MLVLRSYLLKMVWFWHQDCWFCACAVCLASSQSGYFYLCAGGKETCRQLNFQWVFLPICSDAHSCCDHWTGWSHDPNTLDTRLYQNSMLPHKHSWYRNCYKTTYFALKWLWYQFTMKCTSRMYNASFSPLSAKFFSLISYRLWLNCVNVRRTDRMTQLIALETLPTLLHVKCDPRCI